MASNARSSGGAASGSRVSGVDENRAATALGAPAVATGWPAGAVCPAVALDPPDGLPPVDACASGPLVVPAPPNGPPAAGACAICPRDPPDGLPLVGACASGPLVAPDPLEALPSPPWARAVGSWAPVA